MAQVNNSPVEKTDAEGSRKCAEKRLKAVIT